METQLSKYQQKVLDRLGDGRIERTVYGKYIARPVDGESFSIRYPTFITLLKMRRIARVKGVIGTFYHAVEVQS